MFRLATFSSAPAAAAAAAQRSVPYPYPAARAAPCSVKHRQHGLKCLRRLTGIWLSCNPSQMLTCTQAGQWEAGIACRQRLAGAAATATSGLCPRCNRNAHFQCVPRAAIMPPTRLRPAQAAPTLLALPPEVLLHILAAVPQADR